MPKTSDEADGRDPSRAIESTPDPEARITDLLGSNGLVSVGDLDDQDPVRANAALDAYIAGHAATGNLVKTGYTLFRLVQPPPREEAPAASLQLTADAAVPAAPGGSRRWLEPRFLPKMPEEKRVRPKPHPLTAPSNKSPGQEEHGVRTRSRSSRTSHRSGVLARLPSPLADCRSSQSARHFLRYRSKRSRARGGRTEPCRRCQREPQTIPIRCRRHERQPTSINDALKTNADSLNAALGRQSGYGVRTSIDEIASIQRNIGAVQRRVPRDETESYGNIATTISRLLELADTRADSEELIARAYLNGRRGKALEAAGQPWGGEAKKEFVSLHQKLGKMLAAAQADLRAEPQ